MPTYDNTGEGWKNPTSEQIRNLLKKSKVIAVVGLSSNPERASHSIGRYLMNTGYNVIPVNPNEVEVLGEKSYPDLKSIPVKVDIVDVFRKGEAASAITDEAIAVGAKAVWLQEGVISIPAFRRGEEAGMIMVMDRCIYRVHSSMTE